VVPVRSADKITTTPSSTRKRSKHDLTIITDEPSDDDVVKAIRTKSRRTRSIRNKQAKDGWLERAC
jgi:hypothetical protein